jgi:hypothetical protein
VVDPQHPLLTLVGFREGTGVVGSSTEHVGGTEPLAGRDAGVPVRLDARCQLQKSRSVARLTQPLLARRLLVKIASIRYVAALSVVASILVFSADRAEAASAAKIKITTGNLSVSYGPASSPETIKCTSISGHGTVSGDTATLRRPAIVNGCGDSSGNSYSFAAKDWIIAVSGSTATLARIAGNHISLVGSSCEITIDSDAVSGTYSSDTVTIPSQTVKMDVPQGCPETAGLVEGTFTATLDLSAAL